MSFSLDGWNIGHADDIEWSPWGSGNDARAKILTNGDGYYVALVEADAGYHGDAHEHEHTEFLYVDSLPAGLGSNDLGLDRGQQGQGKVVTFQRVGPRVLMAQFSWSF